MIKKIKVWFRIFSLLSPGRLVNLIALHTGYFCSRLAGKPLLWGKPYSFSVEPTTSCNLRCSECPSGLRIFSRNTGMMNLELFEKVIDEIYPYTLYLLLYFQGEPYLNPLFFDFVKYARKKRIYTSTSTNAHYLTEQNARRTVESGLDRIIISLDGIGQETYSAYRSGGRYDKVIDGIKNLVKARKDLRSFKLHIVVQFIVFKTNEHQISQIKSLCEELGVDELQLKTAQIADYKNGNPLIPTIDKFSRYRKIEEGKYVFKNKLPDHCYRMWTGAVITWDGMVVPCCFDKDAEHRMGDLKTETFSRIWGNEKYRNFRQNILLSRKDIEICRNCTEGMKI